MKLVKKKENPEIPTASMADIAFLLIVFFMLTTVISATKGIEHQLPQQDKKTQENIEKEDSVYIRVNADNTFTVDKEPPASIDAVGMLHDYLYPKLSNNWKKPIIIYVNPEAKYESMVAVLDVVKQLESQLMKEKNIPNLTITIPTQAEAETWGYQ